MKKFIGKKAVLLGTLILALGVAVYLNYFFGTDAGLFPTDGNLSTEQPDDDKTLGEAINVNTDAQKPTAEEYFKQARDSRETARDEAVATVKDLLNDVKATEEQKQTATAEAIAIVKAIEQENAIENLIKAKGYTDCVVYIDKNNCDVVVQSGDLTVQDTAKISQIVTSQADISAQNIHIVTVK
ncbi:MAG: SpoIIIAH-like family protein [Clostridia bacterium]|nr:SpoIIIAH-like family protein [Clostridia bacterium]